MRKQKLDSNLKKVDEKVNWPKITRLLDLEEFLTYFDKLDVLRT